MRSASAYTSEYENPVEAARFLSDEIKSRLEFGRSSCGLLFTDNDVDLEALTTALHEYLGIEFIGVTALATMNQNGFHNNGVNVLVLTADDCEFALGMAENLTQENYREKIRKLYDSLSAKLPSKEKLILSYATQTPEISGDSYIEAISSVAGNVIIYGGLASDRFTFDELRVFTHETISHSAIVLLLMSGNVEPMVSVEYSNIDFLTASIKVTQSERNVVYKVGDMSFVEYLYKLGLPPDSNPDQILMQFLSTPFGVSIVDNEKARSSTAFRSLQKVNLEDGSGTFVGDMPEGTVLSVSFLKRGDIITSCRDTVLRCIKQLKDRTDGYTCSTILVTSCAGRYYLLGSSPVDEAHEYISIIQEHNIPLAGYYSLGEFCPTVFSDNSFLNRFHNVTFTALSF